MLQVVLPCSFGLNSLSQSGGDGERDYDQIKGDQNNESFHNCMF
jgi:hypothetical protein